MARPRGAARGSVSAILAMPELAEKRTVTGTSCLKCNALLTLAASALGTNLPSRTTPLAWADRCVVCLPNAELSASTNVSGFVAIAGSFRVFIAALRWNDPSLHSASQSLPVTQAAHVRFGRSLTAAGSDGASRHGGRHAPYPPPTVAGSSLHPHIPRRQPQHP